MLKYIIGLFYVVLLITYTSIEAQDLQMIHFKDSSLIKGNIVSQDTANLKVETPNGTLLLPKANVLKIEFEKQTENYREPTPVYKENIEEKTIKHATSKGCVMINGSLSYAGYSGDLYSDYNTFIFVPNIVLFAMQNLGLGFDMSYNTISENNASSTTLGIGPKILFLGGDPKRSMYFFAGAGMNYITTNDNYTWHDYWGASHYVEIKTSGTRFKFSMGVIPVVKDHLGFPLEVGILIDNITGNNNSASGRVLFMGVGLTGFLY
jgi:hypothetical protein